MTSPPRPIVVRCSRCSAVFESYYRPSINLDLEPWTEDELHEATSATCPRCAAVIDLDALIVDDGVWTVSG